MTRRKRVALGISAAFVGLLGVHGAWVAWTASDWRSASREPAGLAPDPAEVTEPVVQVYAARAWGWRGYFGVHSWVAVKPREAIVYTVYEVIGWRLRWGGTSLAIHHRPADAPLVRPRSGAPRRRTRRGGRGAHRSPRPCRPRLSLRGALPAVAGPQLQHVHRLSRPRGARAPGSICRRPRSARTISRTGCSPPRRGAGCRRRSTASRASSRGRPRGSRSTFSGWCSAPHVWPPALKLPVHRPHRLEP